MGKIIDLNSARELMKKYNKEEFHRKHAEVVSAVLRRFAETRDPERADYWAVVGMLHDIDFEQYPNEHCVKSREILREHDVDEGIINSVVSHGFGLTGSDVEPTLEMEKVLFATDELTGLIGAAAMVRPSKSVSDMEPSSVKKKFKTPAFAAGCSREVILKGAEMLGVSLDELIAETLAAMKADVGSLKL